MQESLLPDFRKKSNKDSDNITDFTQGEDYDSKGAEILLEITQNNNNISLIRIANTKELVVTVNSIQATNLSPGDFNFI